MTGIAQLNRNQPIADDEGRSTDVFAFWAESITRLDIFNGVGSPESVVDAAPGRLYFDTAGTTGSILYIKRDSDIAGDSKKGWILV